MVDNIHYLAYSGGGIKAIGFAGVEKSFEEEGINKQIKGIIGTSGGAIFAALRAVGYTVDDAKDIFMKTEFNKFEDSPWSVFGEGYRLCSSYGFYLGNYAENWIEDKIQAKTGKSGTTFRDIFEKCQLELVITGCSFTKKVEVYFSYLTTPDMRVSQAVRVSMSIPIAYVPVKINNELMIDGGTLNNYPIDYFAKRGFLDQTVGVLLLGGGLIPGGRMFYGNDKVDNLKEYFLHLIDLLTLQNERSHITPEYWNRTISIDTKDISTLDFNLTPEQKEMLFNQGYEAGKQFIARLKSGKSISAGVANRTPILDISSQDLSIYRRQMIKYLSRKSSSYLSLFSGVMVSHLKKFIN